jgi:hypothetical protein
MKDLNKLSVQLWMSIALVLFGIIMIVASFIVPPLGVIDSSVLVAYGETLTFVGALVGVDYSYKYKLRNR